MPINADLVNRLVSAIDLPDGSAIARAVRALQDFAPVESISIGPEHDGVYRLRIKFADDRFIAGQLIATSNNDLFIDVWWSGDAARDKKLERRLVDIAWDITHVNVTINHSSINLSRATK